MTTTTETPVPVPGERRLFVEEALNRVVSELREEILRAGPKSSLEAHSLEELADELVLRGHTMNRVRLAVGAAALRWSGGRRPEAAARVRMSTATFYRDYGSRKNPKGAERA